MTSCSAQALSAPTHTPAPARAPAMPRTRGRDLETSPSLAPAEADTGAGALLWRTLLPVNVLVREGRAGECACVGKGARARGQMASRNA